MAGGQLERVTWRDDKGMTATTRFFVASGGTLTTQNTAALAIINTLGALSNASIQGYNGPANAPAIVFSYGTNAEYESVEDKAVFTFFTPAGSIHRFQIPAPKIGIFLADGETVDQTNVDVVAFTSAVVANAFTRDDQAITFGGMGFRQRRKIKRKFNIYTLNPGLTGPGL